MTSPYISLNVLRQDRNISTINIGINVNTLPSNSNIRYVFDALSIDNVHMSNIQPTNGSFSYTTLNGILDYADNNSMKVNVNSVLKSLPTWFTTLSDTNLILNTTNTYVNSIVNILKRNTTKSIDLIDNVINNSGSDKYKTTFLETKIGDSNHISTIFHSANNTLGSSKIKLFYNHSNAENGYDTTGTFCSTLRDFKTYRYPIDGVSFDINADSNTKLVRIEKTVRNLRAMGYNIRFNDVNFSIPNTSTENLKLQANFYESLIEICLNFKIDVSFSSFNDSDKPSFPNSLLFSNNSPKLAYSQIINLMQNYDTNILNCNTHVALYNPTDLLNKWFRNFIYDFPKITNFTPETLTNSSGISNITFLTSFNRTIPDDFFGVSSGPAAYDPYGKIKRKSYFNLMNVFKYSKYTTLGMRYRIFTGMGDFNDPRSNYRNNKTLESYNAIRDINGACEIQFGAGGIKSSSNYNDSNIYPKLLDQIEINASNIISKLHPSIFESLSIFNEPGFEKNEFENADDYARVLKDIINRIYPIVGDSIVIGSFHYINDLYKKLIENQPNSILKSLQGKIKSFAHHVYPGSCDYYGNKACETTANNKCIIRDSEGLIINGTLLPQLPIPNNLISPPLGTVPRLRSGKDTITIKSLLDKTSYNDPNINYINNTIRNPIGYTGTYKYGYHLNETNSICVSGVYGVSDTFAAALWLIQWGLIVAYNDIKRMNLHGGYTPEAAYNMIHYPDTYNESIEFDSIITPMPLFYGYWFLHFATRCNPVDRKSSKITGYLITGDKDLRVWRIENGSEHTFVIIYVDNNNGDNNINLGYNRVITCNIPSPLTVARTAKLYRLFSKNGINKNSGIIFGNLTLDGTNTGIPYNVKTGVEITLSETGISNGLEFENVNSTQSASKFSYSFLIKSPSACILRIPK